MNSFPNGVYGINLSTLLQGPGVSDLALLEEITNRFEEVGDADGEMAFREFSARLNDVLEKRGIHIPSLTDSLHTGELVFRIHQVDPHAEICDDEDFDQGDLILGVGIFGFPNDIKFTEDFVNAAAWHLWTIDG